ncbi:hypothetical protein FS749_008593 [Ceratobasidium sp. UAMH 11750]|nr:hypothetical protein FS749_008593 [Ceratobasidium sp. UAMH 11750]
MAPPTTAQTALNAKRAAKRHKEAEIIKALHDVESEVYKLLDTAAERLGVETSELRARFMAQGAAQQHAAEPTAWNGFLHMKAKELAHLKSQFPGVLFMNEVSRQVKQSGEYDQLTEQELQHYKAITQKVRDDRLSAGKLGDGDSQQLTQGSVKKDLVDIVLDLDCIYEATKVESVLFVVKGNSDAGLKPIYYASPKAREFVESHIKLKVPQFLHLMEKSVDGGAIGVAGAYKNDTQSVKGRLRTVMVESLRAAATTQADDGSEPYLDDPEKIATVSWKHYWVMVRNYRVEAFNWPMSDDGASMKDPSDLGGYTELSRLLEDVESGKRGFRRLTDADWEARMEEYRTSVEAGTVTAHKRKPRADRGQTKKRPAALTDSANPAKKKRTAKATAAEPANTTTIRSTTPASPAPSVTRASPSQPTPAVVNDELPDVAAPEHSNSSALAPDMQSCHGNFVGHDSPGFEPHTPILAPRTALFDTTLATTPLATVADSNYSMTGLGYWDSYAGNDSPPLPDHLRVNVSSNPLPFYQASNPPPVLYPLQPYVPSPTPSSSTQPPTISVPTTPRRRRDPWQVTTPETYPLQTARHRRKKGQALPPSPATHNVALPLAPTPHPPGNAFTGAATELGHVDWVIPISF